MRKIPRVWGSGDVGWDEWVTGAKKLEYWREMRGCLER